MRTIVHTTYEFTSIEVHDALVKRLEAMGIKEPYVNSIVFNDAKHTVSIVGEVDDGA